MKMFYNHEYRTLTNLGVVGDHAKFAYIDAVLKTKLIRHFPLWTFTKSHFFMF